MSQTFAITVCILAPDVDSDLLKRIKSFEWAQKVLVGLTSNSPITIKEKIANLEIISVTTDQPIQNFSSLRNKLDTFVTTPWVIHIDSDEQLTNQLVSSIKHVINQKQIAVYALKRQDIFYGQALQYAEGGNSWLARLYPAGQATWHNAVHETLASQLITLKLDGALEHYSHSSTSEFITATARYAKIVALHTDEPAWLTFLKGVFFPPLKLTYNLIIRGGILDGWRGVVYAWIMSLHSLAVRVYVYEKNAHTH